MRLAHEIPAIHLQILLAWQNQYSPYPLCPYQQMPRTMMLCHRQGYFFEAVQCPVIPSSPKNHSPQANRISKSVLQTPIQNQLSLARQLCCLCWRSCRLLMRIFLYSVAFEIECKKERWKVFLYWIKSCNFVLSIFMYDRWAKRQMFSYLCVWQRPEWWRWHYIMQKRHKRFVYWLLWT